MNYEEPSKSIPLPPNFLPLEHKVGDKVVVKGFYLSNYNDVVGVVERVPTSLSGPLFSSRAYRIRALKSTAYPDAPLDFLPEFLHAHSTRVEGEEIAHKVVRIGDTIRVTHSTTMGRYTQSSVREGVVSSITYSLEPKGKKPWEHYIFRGWEEGKGVALNFQTENEIITLVKAAEDPWKAIVEGLTAGTVVVRENKNGSTTTYVKAPDWHTSSQWHIVSSLSTKSSTFVSDSDVIEILGTGEAEIVHKVRKK
jgi:hypothetical protein